MNKEIFVVYSAECVMRLRKIKLPKKTIVVSVSDEASELLRRHGIPFKSEKDYKFNIKGYEERFWDQFEIIKKFENIIYKEKALRDHLSVAGISIFDLLSETYYEFGIIRIVNVLGFLDKILPYEKAGEVTCFGNSRMVIVEKNRNIFPSMIESAAKKHDAAFRKIGRKTWISELSEWAVHSGLDLLIRARSLKRKRLARYKLDSDSKTVLFINMGAHGRRMDITKPVHEELKKKKYNSLTICADGFRSDSTSEALMNERMDFANYEHFSDRDIKRKASRYSGKMIRTWRAIQSDPEATKQASFLGMPIFPVMENFYNSIIVFKSRIFIEMILTMEKIYKRLKPSATVVVSDQNHFSLVGIYISKKSDVPSFTIQHGSYGSIIYPPNTDFFAAWSEEDKKNIKKTMTTENLKNMERREKQEGMQGEKDNNKKNEAGQATKAREEETDQKHHLAKRKIMDFIEKNLR
jgi:hypothetical protein